MPVFSRRALPALLSALLHVAPAAAGPGDRLDDYSHRIGVSVSGKQAVVRLPLPPAVYLEARSPDLRDLRLFDAAGTALPFALVAQLPQAREDRSSAPVAVFPLRGPAGSSRLPDGLEIRTGADGAVISVHAPVRRESGDVLHGLVLDLQGGARAPASVDALSFTLPANVGSYSARVVLEASDDLQQWDEVARSSLNWLVNNQGAQVRQDRIAFPAQPLRFARLRWIEGQALEFAAVTAHRVAQQRSPVQWDSVVLQPRPAAAATGADLVYDAPLAAPVEALGLELQGANIVMPVLVGQYRAQGSNAGPAPLQALANTTFFRLTQDGQQRASGLVEVPLTHAAQWVVRPQAASAERPGLRLRWKPATMVFVAGGKPPYTLAFGADGVATAEVPVGQVAPGFSVQELATLEQARAGEPLRQGPDRASAASQAAGDARTRKLLLWALLLVGVAVLAGMAWRLSRQLKEEPGDQPPG